MPEPAIVSTTAQWRSFLQRQLPEQMIPAAFVVLDRLPLTPNGKVNRGALPVPTLDRAEADLVAPRTPIEAALSDMWAKLLGCQEVGIDENFFDLGGDSLLAMQLLAQIQAFFQVELTLGNVFETPTVAGLAQTLVSKQAEDVGPEALSQLITELDDVATDGLQDTRAGNQMVAPAPRKWSRVRQLLPGLLGHFNGRNAWLWRLNTLYWRPLLRITRWYRATMARRTCLVAIVGSYGKTTRRGR